MCDVNSSFFLQLSTSTWLVHRFDTFMYQPMLHIRVIDTYLERIQHPEWCNQMCTSWPVVNVDLSYFAWLWSTSVLVGSSTVPMTRPEVHNGAGLVACWGSILGRLSRQRGSKEIHNSSIWKPRNAQSCPKGALKLRCSLIHSCKWGGHRAELGFQMDHVRSV